MPKRASVGVEMLLEFTLFTPTYRDELGWFSPAEDATAGASGRGPRVTGSRR